MKVECRTGGSKWRYALVLAAAVLCIAVGAGCPGEKSGSAKAAAAATEAKNSDASASGEQNAEDAATGAEDGGYTYEYYEGDSVPYYRGYYYIGGSWVWRGHGRAPCPPPQFRPVLRSKPSSAKAASTKAAPAKPVRVKRVPAKSVRHGGGRASALKGAPRR